jgi:hypothetical protein
MEVSDVRRRLRAAIESARKNAQERRVRADAAARDYEQFLRDRAVPIFHTVASALTAEGHRFTVFTPADGVRLAAQSGDDFIELALDAAADPPVVLGRVSHGRGRRRVALERPVRENAPISELTDEDVVTFVVSEIAPFVER